jgi:hypothetical protein
MSEQNDVIVQGNVIADYYPPVLRIDHHARSNRQLVADGDCAAPQAKLGQVKDPGLSPKRQRSSRKESLEAVKQTKTNHEISNSSSHGRRLCAACRPAGSSLAPEQRQFTGDFADCLGI